MKSSIASLLTVIAVSASAQDHGHLNLGASGVDQSDPLIFENAAIFETATNYVKTLMFASSGAYAGYYQGNITFTTLAATPDHAGPEPNAAALGAQIVAQLVSVEGPAGGAFAFWDTGATSPTISLACGLAGTNTWRVSENDGSPGSDPYGHIHGRRFTATKPGIYTVGFRALDVCTNGVGGGPIHAPSAVIKVYFQAGVNIKSITSVAEDTVIVLSAPVGWNWSLEAGDSLGSAGSWMPIGELIPGDDHFHTITNHAPSAGWRFYRARGDVP